MSPGLLTGPQHGAFLIDRGAALDRHVNEIDPEISRDLAVIVDVEDQQIGGLAEFERDLFRERVKSGLAAARDRGVKLGRQPGQRPSDKKAKRVLEMHRDGVSYRLIGRNLGLSKNTVMEIVKRAA